MFQQYPELFYWRQLTGKRDFIRVLGTVPQLLGGERRSIKGEGFVFFLCAEERLI